MVKAYLDYKLNNSIGNVCLNYCKNIFFKKENVLLMGNREYLSLISLKTGEIKEQIRFDIKSSISIINYNKNNYPNLIVIGFMDGTVIVYDYNNKEELIKFEEHDSEITDLKFYKNEQCLISCSKNTNIVIMDLVSNTIKFKLTGHSSIVNFIKVIKDHNVLVTGSNDGLIRFWDLKYGYSLGILASKLNFLTNILKVKVETSKDNYENFYWISNESENLILYQEKHYEENNQSYYWKQISKIKRNFYSKIKILKNYNNYIFCLSDNNMIEVYKLNDYNIYKKKIKRKEKRNLDIEDNDIKFNIYFEFITNYKSWEKINYFEIVKNQLDQEFFLVIYYNKNYYEYVKFINDKFDQLHLFENLGHKKEIKNIILSNDDTLLATVDLDNIKIWSTNNDLLLKVINIEKCNICRFLPLDRYLLIGDTKGKLLLHDIQLNETIDKEEAHKLKVNSIDLKLINNKKLLILTSSNDCSFKFWNLITKNNKLKLVLMKNIKVNEEILNASITYDGKYFAGSLLNNNIEIYYIDTGKIFISLIGHKLPINSFDISNDNSILASGSNDKNIKIWALDFGNCKKSIFAHNSGISQVKFVKDTHYLFSVSKDYTIKYWDMDLYQQVLELNINNEMINNITISSLGDFFYISTVDKIIRKFIQTKEQIFIKDFQEKKKDEMFMNNELKDDNITDEQKRDLYAQRMFKDFKYGEEIMESIDYAEGKKEPVLDYENKLAKYLEDSKINPELEKPIAEDIFVLNNLSIPEYVYEVINRIKPNELEKSFKFVHFSYMGNILYYIKYFAEKNKYNELNSRLFKIIIDKYMYNLLNNEEMTRLLIIIQSLLKQNLKENIKQARYNINFINLFNKESQKLSSE